jgi:hypothetical protein
MLSELEFKKIIKNELNYEYTEKGVLIKFYGYKFKFNLNANQIESFLFYDLCKYHNYIILLGYNEMRSKNSRIHYPEIMKILYDNIIAILREKNIENVLNYD